VVRKGETWRLKKRTGQLDRGSIAVEGENKTRENKRVGKFRGGEIKKTGVRGWGGGNETGKFLIRGIPKSGKGKRMRRGKFMGVIILDRST